MAASPEGNKLVQFAPFSSAIDAAFWHKLTQNKLDVYHLDDKPKKLQAYFVNSEYFDVVKVRHSCIAL